MLIEFWDSFYDQCTTGDFLKVPYLSHNFEAKDWKSIAMVLAMGWIQQRILPIHLVPSFFNASLHGISADILRVVFLCYRK